MRAGRSPVVDCSPSHRGHPHKRAMTFSQDQSRAPQPLEALLLSTGQAKTATLVKSNASTLYGKFSVYYPNVRPYGFSISIPKKSSNINRLRFTVCAVVSVMRNSHEFSTLFRRRLILCLQFA